MHSSWIAATCMGTVAARVPELMVIMAGERGVRVDGDGGQERMVRVDDDSCGGQYRERLGAAFVVCLVYEW